MSDGGRQEDNRQLLSLTQNEGREDSSFFRSTEEVKYLSDEINVWSTGGGGEIFEPHEAGVDEVDMGFAELSDDLKHHNQRPGPDKIDGHQGPCEC